MDAHILDRLYEILRDRKQADPESSYAASLYARGTKKIAQKLIEEAGETVIEALSGTPETLKAEAADLLFHLLVLLADRNIHPDEVFAVLESRLGTGGLEEKAGRKNP
ncbi:MAG: phosphoribosyl-ATP diphosphatase [Alphaproteobacteria bacterium]|nr:phosphoribosyl-ATP diphosphatase [Alphaproteobacteria bacterium]